jgi:hypothetical protein
MIRSLVPITDGKDTPCTPATPTFCVVPCQRWSYSRDIYRPPYAFTTADPVTVPVSSVLWLDS